MAQSKEFTVFPAIDLLNGQVVRLKMGDRERKTTYSDDPEAIARNWLAAGARWLHVVNLDGAFGDPDLPNQRALEKILKVSSKYTARVQFGGGLRSLASIEQALSIGVSRVILGTVVIEEPDIFYRALEQWGNESIAAGLDARDGFISVRGWKEGTSLSAMTQAQQLQANGLRWLVYTDIARDGLLSGVNIAQTIAIARQTNLQVIASGGVNSLDDVQRVQEAGLDGVIVGQALYSGAIDSLKLLGEEKGAA
jgi:phosphoribosylformimino-5-aminoimidazole carboxamide ribotide isomerase